MPASATIDSHPHQNFRGALLMTTSMAGFAINDTIIKTFGGELSLGQVVALRGFFASFFVVIVAWRLGHLRPISLALQPLMLVRTAAEISATLTFLLGLFHLPLANASAIMQVLPLVLTLFAAISFGETIGWRRIVAIIIGLIGVLIIIRPGMEGFSLYSLFILGSVASCAVRDLITRRLHGDIPALFISLATAVGVMITGSIMCLFQPWLPITTSHLALLATSSVFLMIGYYFVIAAMRTGSIGFVSPFRYMVLVFSIIGGMVAFGEFPDLYTWLGASIVVATGIYTLYRERVVRRQAITPLRVRF